MSLLVAAEIFFHWGLPFTVRNRLLKFHHIQNCRIHIELRDQGGFVDSQKNIRAENIKMN